MDDSTINRPPQDDWRRQGQEDYLTGVKLSFRIYKPYREDWDHDHCEFCGKKISLKSGDLNSGYSTDDGYHWICAPCMHDFRAEFKWEVNNELCG